MRHDFIGFDDNHYVTENPHVTAGLTRAGLWWALTDSPLGEWCPLTVVSQMLDCQLYGLNPAGHYLTNVLLHAASTVLLFLVLLRMTGALAKCLGGRRLRHSSAACRISGLVSRAPGRTERIVFHADVGRRMHFTSSVPRCLDTWRSPDFLPWA